MKKNKIYGALCTLLIVSFTLINDANAKRKVGRIDENETIDLSGRWNDTDSRLVSEEMIAQALGGAWISDFSSEHNGEKPKVIVGWVTNKTSEHIETETFIKDLEKAFINSGKVRVVQDAAKRDQLRNERSEQQDFASASTKKNWSQELGADFMIQGTIASIIDQYKKTKIVFYQIDLELSNIETNEKVWIGDKKIKKEVKR